MLYTDSTEQRAAARVIIDLTKQGVNLPRPVIDAVDAAEAISERLDRVVQEVAQPADLALDLLTTKDATAEQLRRAVAGLLLTNSEGHGKWIRVSATRRVVAALTDNVDQVIESLRPSFDKAVADLDAAAGVLVGIDSLDDVAAVTDLGGDAAAYWKSATAASRVITGVIATIQQLGMARCYEGVNDPRERLLAVAELDLPAFKKVSPATTPWELRSLATLSLATPGEKTARQGQIDAAWARDPRNPVTRGVGQSAADLAVAAEQVAAFGVRR